MKDEEIIAIARESELITRFAALTNVEREKIIAFARAIADIQKEKDAKICENAKDYFCEKDGHKFPELKDSADDGSRYCADAIRSAKLG